MSSAKIYSSQQFEQIQHETQCPRCHQKQQLYIELGCKHKFCIVCITFAYLKFKNLFIENNKIKCLECNNVSELDSQSLNLINQIINKELGPIISKKQQDGSMASQNQTNPGGILTGENYITGERNGKSEEHSFIINTNGNITPTVTNKYTYSKCESPENGALSSDICYLHPTQQLSYVCMSCSVKPLCYKCIKSNKHADHDVKIIKKAIQILLQRVSLINLEIKQKVENDQLFHKRLYDRKLIFQERIEKNMKQVQGIFETLVRKIQEKSLEIINQFKEYYMKKIQLMEDKMQNASILLKNTKEFKEKITDFINVHEKMLNGLTKTSFLPKDSKNHQNSQEEARKSHMFVKNIKPSELIEKYYEIENERHLIIERSSLKEHQHHQDFLMASKARVNPKSSLNFNLNEFILDPLNYQSNRLAGQISKIFQFIDNINGDIKRQLNRQEEIVAEEWKNQTLRPYTSINQSQSMVSKNKTMNIKFEQSKEKLHGYQNELENSVATKNMKKNKISTNIKSLNTSRDKKQKKYTKTQQDERKLKSKINCKTEQSKYHPKDHLKADGGKPYHQNTIQTAKNNYQTQFLKNQKMTIDQLKSEEENNPGTYHQQQQIQGGHYPTKELPAYVSKYIEKHQNKQTKITPFNSATVYLMENLSKNNSKIISKSNVTGDDIKKKKYHQQKDITHSGKQGKQRVQRKTVNVNTSSVLASATNKTRANELKKKK